MLHGSARHIYFVGRVGAWGWYVTTTCCDGALIVFLSTSMSR
jgi:hypothetical protein